MNVAVLTYDGAALFELGCAVELFGLPRPEFERWYACDVISFEAGPLGATGGVQLQAKRVDDLDAYDMLVIPSWPVTGMPLAPEPARTLEAAVRKFHVAGKRFLSFCSGAFLLAQLGLLDGRKVTTHWRYAERLQQLFPAVSYVDNVLYVYDGDIGCSAGSAAAIDLGIEVIRRDFGYVVANQVARRLVMAAHRRGGKAQFVETPLLEHPRQFSAALDWALIHLKDIGDVGDLAQQANMSRRTFDRRFRSTFSLTPNAWLIQQKLERAKRLLEEGDDSIEAVAEGSGFRNAVTMRHHFRRLTGLSPRQYQDQFRVSRTEVI